MIKNFQVEPYKTRRGPDLWEIRYFTDQGERMSWETFPSYADAMAHAQRAVQRQRAKFFYI